MKNIVVAVLEKPGDSLSLKKIKADKIVVKSLKDLVRALVEQPIDLVICSAERDISEKAQKIFDNYQVPFLFYGSLDTAPLKDPNVYFQVESKEKVEDQIGAMTSLIASLKIQRENRKIRFIIDSLKAFTSSVLHTSKDLFIAELKGYFKKSFKMKDCHWIAVNNESARLPPILQVKNELESQKMNHSSLIKDIESCSKETFHSDSLQIWKTYGGESIGFLWIHGEGEVSHCLILNKVKFRSQEEFQEFLIDLIPFLIRRWHLCNTLENAQDQVYRDSLTNLYNQKFLVDVLDKKIEENRRYKTPFSVLFIDVDHFKRVNDSLGHVVGSGVLTSLGGLLKSLIRSSDYAFRYGGDEFIILLSHTEGDDAVQVAERVRTRVEATEFEVNGVQVQITVSIGLAFFPLHAQSADDIVRIADEAMYYGKNKSRNIVYKASS